MFERNRIENKPEPATVPVEIEMADGSETKGKLTVPAGQSPFEALNGPGGFIEFTPYGSQPRYIAKARIAAMAHMVVPRQPHLHPRGASSDGFDPHIVLGISTESTWEEVRQAYLRLSKCYHPDCYSNAVLPDEVKSYLETMARRINAAYSALEISTRTVRRTRAEVSQPVFTSHPRV